MNTITMTAGTLRDLLTGTLVAAGKDATLPTLTAIQFAWDDTTGTVTVASTDRYRLAVGKAQATVEGSGTLLIPNMYAKQLEKLLPKSPRVGMGPMATVTVNGSDVSMTVDSSTVTFQSQAGDFPKWKQLIPTEATDTDGISFNPAYMADVAKLPHYKNAAVTWAFHGRTRPAVATYPLTDNGIDWLYLLMPVRLAA